MATPLQIRLRVDSAEALDAFRQVATQAGLSFEQVEKAVQKATGETAKAEKGIQALAAKYDEAFAVQKRFADDMARLGALEAKLGSDNALVVKVRQDITSAMQAGSVAVREHGQAQGLLQRQFGLSGNAAQNLGYQINDLVTQIGSGASPMRAFAQQGGQIFQVMQQAEGGVKGFLSRGITPTTVGLTALAGGMALVIARAVQLETEMRQITVAVQGAGRAGEVSAKQIEGIIEAERKLGATIDDARASALAFAKAPIPAGLTNAQLGTLNQDLAARLGIGNTESTKLLIDVLSKGAPVLREHGELVRLIGEKAATAALAAAEMGDKEGGLRIILEALRTTTKGAAEQLAGPLKAATNEMAAAWRGLLDVFAKTSGTSSVIANLAGDIRSLAQSVDMLNKGVSTEGIRSLIRLALGFDPASIGVTPKTGGATAPSPGSSAPLSLSIGGGAAGVGQRVLPILEENEGSARYARAHGISTNDVVSDAGAIGLYQVTPGAAMDPRLGLFKGMSRAQVAEQLRDPTVNQQVALAYANMLGGGAAGGDPLLTAIGYHSGEGGIANFQQRGLLGLGKAGRQYAENTLTALSRDDSFGQDPAAPRPYQVGDAQAAAQVAKSAQDAAGAYKESDAALAEQQVKLDGIVRANDRTIALGQVQQGQRAAVTAAVEAEQKAREDGLAPEKARLMGAEAYRLSIEQSKTAIRDENELLMKQAETSTAAAAAYSTGTVAGLRAEAEARAEVEKITKGVLDVDARREAILKANATASGLEVARRTDDLTRQVALEANLGAAAGVSAAAYRDASIHNDAIAATQKDIDAAQATLNPQLIRDAEARRDAYEIQLKQLDVDKQRTQYQGDLRAANDNLAIAQQELALAGQLPEVRQQEVALLQTKLQLMERYPGLAQAERDKLAATLVQQQAIDRQAKATAAFVDQSVAGTSDALSTALFEGGEAGLASFKSSFLRTIEQLASRQVFDPLFQAVFGSIFAEIAAAFGVGKAGGIFGAGSLFGSASASPVALAAGVAGAGNTTASGSSIFSLGGIGSGLEKLYDGVTNGFDKLGTSIDNFAIKNIPGFSAPTEVLTPGDIAAGLGPSGTAAGTGGFLNTGVSASALLGYGNLAYSGFNFIQKPSVSSGVDVGLAALSIAVPEVGIPLTIAKTLADALGIFGKSVPHTPYGVQHADVINGQLQSGGYRGDAGLIGDLLPAINTTIGTTLDKLGLKAGSGVQLAGLSIESQGKPGDGSNPTYRVYNALTGDAGQTYQSYEEAAKDFASKALLAAIKGAEGPNDAVKALIANETDIDKIAAILQESSTYLGTTLPAALDAANAGVTDLTKTTAALVDQAIGPAVKSLTDFRTEGQKFGASNTDLATITRASIESMAGLGRGTQTAVISITDVTTAYFDRLEKEAVALGESAEEAADVKMHGLANAMVNIGEGATTLAQVLTTAADRVVLKAQALASQAATDVASIRSSLGQGYLDSIDTLVKNRVGAQTIDDHGGVLQSTTDAFNTGVLSILSGLDASKLGQVAAYAQTLTGAAAPFGALIAQLAGGFVDALGVSKGSVNDLVSALDKQADATSAAAAAAAQAAQDASTELQLRIRLATAQGNDALARQLTEQGELADAAANHMSAANIALLRQAQAAEDAKAATDQLAQSMQQLRQAGKGIHDYLASLDVSQQSPLSPRDQLASAQAEYQRQLGLAQGGDVDASQAVTGAFQRYLQAAEGVYAHGEAYGAIFSQGKAQLAALPATKSYEEQLLEAVKGLGDGIDVTVQASVIRNITETLQALTDADRQTLVMPATVTRLIDQVVAAAPALTPDQLMLLQQTTTTYTRTVNFAVSALPLLTADQQTMLRAQGETFTNTLTAEVAALPALSDEQRKMLLATGQGFTNTFSAEVGALPSLDEAQRTILLAQGEAFTNTFSAVVGVWPILSDEQRRALFAVSTPFTNTMTAAFNSLPGLSAEQRAALLAETGTYTKTLAAAFADFQITPDEAAALHAQDETIQRTIQQNVTLSGALVTAGTVNSDIVIGLGNVATYLGGPGSAMYGVMVDIRHLLDMIEKDTYLIRHNTFATAQNTNGVVGKEQGVSGSETFAFGGSTLAAWYNNPRYVAAVAVAPGTPGFADGTLSAPPGWAWVGEAGAELIRMRGGEQVVPHDASMAMASAYAGAAHYAQGTPGWMIPAPANDYWQPRGGADNGAMLRELAALRAEVAKLREENNRANGLNSVENVRALKEVVQQQVATRDAIDRGTAQSRSDAEAATSRSRSGGKRAAA